MKKKAYENKHWPLLKLKLGKSESVSRVRAVRSAVPNTRLIVDANEAWTLEELNKVSPALSELGVELIEQPLPSKQDAELSNYNQLVPLCADESCLDRQSLNSLKNKFHYINIKLDKTGGLTEALSLAAEAKKMGFDIMVGSMVGTSLAMAPAMVVGALASFCDLDGPLLLKEDREPGIHYEKGSISFPSRDLWG